MRGCEAGIMYLSPLFMIRQVLLLNIRLSDVVFQPLSSRGFFIKEDNNKIASLSPNCKPSGVFIFTLQLVQSGRKFV